MNHVAIILAVLVGALNIRQAITLFDSGLYFLCGLNIMTAVCMAALIFKNV